MQRKRNEDGGLAGRGSADLRRKPSRPRRKPSQHSTFFGKIAIFVECWDGLEALATTKVPVPIVVVLNNVLCRGLGLAALADRVDDDVQQQQQDGHNHDEHGELALTPVAAGERLLLVDVLLAVLGTHAMH